MLLRITFDDIPTVIIPTDEYNISYQVKEYYSDFSYFNRNEDKRNIYNKPVYYYALINDDKHKPFYLNSLRSDFTEEEAYKIMESDRLFFECFESVDDIIYECISECTYIDDNLRAGFNYFNSEDKIKNKIKEDIRLCEKNIEYLKLIRQKMLEYENIIEITTIFENDQISIDHFKSKYQESKIKDSIFVIPSCMINEISDKYYNYIVYEQNKGNISDDYILETDPMVQFYSTNHFNQQIIKEYESYCKDNGGAEYVIEKLTNSYENLQKKLMML
jgi:hypothetical protein